MEFPRAVLSTQATNLGPLMAHSSFAGITGMTAFDVGEPARARVAFKAARFGRWLPAAPRR
jgi:hypothetical protein